MTRLAEILSSLRGRLSLVIGYLEIGDNGSAERELEAALVEARAALAEVREAEAA